MTNKNDLNFWSLSLSMGASQSTTDSKVEVDTLNDSIISNQPETTQEVTVDEPDDSSMDWLWPII